MTQIKDAFEFYREYVKPVLDGQIAAIAASKGFIVASRDVSLYEAAVLKVINPWII